MKPPPELNVSGIHFIPKAPRSWLKLARPASDVTSVKRGTGLATSSTTRPGFRESAHPGAISPQPTANTYTRTGNEQAYIDRSARRKRTPAIHYNPVCVSVECHLDEF